MPNTNYNYIHKNRAYYCCRCRCCHTTRCGLYGAYIAHFVVPFAVPLLRVYPRYWFWSAGAIEVKNRKEKNNTTVYGTFARSVQAIKYRFFSVQLETVYASHAHDEPHTLSANPRNIIIAHLFIDNQIGYQLAVEFQSAPFTLHPIPISSPSGRPGSTFEATIHIVI